MSSRVFCHQGSTRDVSLSWNNFLWTIPRGEKPGVNVPGEAVGNEKCYKREAGSFLPSCTPQDQTDGVVLGGEAISGFGKKKIAGDVLCRMAAAGITGDISSRAGNAAGSYPSSYREDLGSFPGTLASGQSLNSQHLSSCSWKGGRVFFPASGISWAVRTLGHWCSSLPCSQVQGQVQKCHWNDF